MFFSFLSSSTRRNALREWCQPRKGGGTGKGGTAGVGCSKCPPPRQTFQLAPSVAWQPRAGRTSSPGRVAAWHRFRPRVNHHRASPPPPPCTACAFTGCGAPAAGKPSDQALRPGSTECPSFPAPPVRDAFLVGVACQSG